MITDSYRQHSFRSGVQEFRSSTSHLLKMHRYINRLLLLPLPWLMIMTSMIPISLWKFLRLLFCVAFYPSLMQLSRTSVIPVKTFFGWYFSLSYWTYNKWHSRYSFFPLLISLTTHAASLDINGSCQVFFGKHISLFCWSYNKRNFYLLFSLCCWTVFFGLQPSF